MAEGEHTGQRPPPLVEAFAAALQQAHVANDAHSRTAFNEQLTEWLEAFEAEHAGVIAGVMQRVLESGALPPTVHAMISSIASPIHQTQVILGLFSIGAIVREFVSAVIAPYVQDAANKSWSADPTAPASPAEAAIGVIKGHVDFNTAQGIAAMSGIGHDMFALIVDNTGEPPGLMQLAEAYRRGIIDAGTFEKGVRQSRVRDEWTQTLLALRYQPVAPGEVLAGAVQGHLDPADASQRLSFAGIDPTNYDWLYATHGRPPGIMEMLHLLNRGVVAQSEVEQAIRESDIKNKYIPALLEMRRQLMPQRTIVSAIRQGVLTPEEGITRLLMIGYNADDAHVLASEATATKHQRTRDLTEQQILSLYAEGFIAEAEAATMLGNLGFDATEVRWVIALADHARHERFQQSAITAVHSRFVAHHVDKATAQRTLDDIGVPAAARDDLLTLWTSERNAHVAQLTRADLKALHKLGKLTHDEYRTRLLNMGYTDLDADLILEL